MTLKLLIAALLFLCSAESSEKFIPAHVQDTKLQACAVGGNADGTTDAFVIAQYSGERYAEYRATIARRDSYKAAVADCIVWFNDVSKAFIEAYNGKKEAEVPKPQTGVPKP